MYSHSLFFDMISDVDDATEWIQDNMEEMAYSAVLPDTATGAIELNFYTHDTLSEREQRTLVSATSPRRYTFNNEE